MISLPKGFLCFILAVIPVLLPGQEHPVFSRLDEVDGLSNLRITSIVKDPAGFVWIGTKNGLNRFDGKEFRVYRKQNSSIGSNDIADLCMDSGGALWVATLGGGLSRYDARTDSFTVFKENAAQTGALISNQVNCIIRGHNGDLWAGTEKGLSRFSVKDSVFTNYTAFPGGNSITALCEDKENRIWVGAFGGGVSMFLPGSETFRNITEGIDRNAASYVYSMAVLNDDTILVGTGDSGLLKLNIREQCLESFDGIPRNIREEITIVRSVSQDSRGNIWIGTDGNGIFKVEDYPGNPQVRNFRFRKNITTSVSGNAIYEITEDEEHNIWIGTAWNGVNILDQNTRHEFIYSDIKGENPAPVLSVHKTGKELLLGLDGNGLTRYNEQDGSVAYFNKASGKPIGASYIQYILDNGDKTYWLGSFSGGLIRLNGTDGSYKQYKYESDNNRSLSYNDVRYILKDGNHLWIATWGGGLNCFDTDKETFTNYREEGNSEYGPSSDNLISLQKDGDRLWIATFGGGLNCLDLNTGVFRKFLYEENNDNSVSGDNLFALLKDSRGYLWIGTSGEGINRYDPRTGSFERFSDRENVRYLTVTAIVEDDRGRIWFSTKQGIFNYDYQTDSFNVFSELSGEFHINAAYKDDNGALYFGGINGALKFDPDRMIVENRNPKVAFTNFKLFNRQVSVGENSVLRKAVAYQDGITLRHNMDVITFEFAALKFPSSTDCEYAIQMEEFDEDWRYIGEDRTATYTNLPPGNYIFKVKSRIKGGDWGNAFTAIRLHILKPWWLQWWAFVIYGLLIITMFYLFRKYIVAWETMKANLRMERYSHEKDTELYLEKQRFFTNISHEIRTPVTLMTGALNHLVSEGSFVEKKQQNAVNTLKKNGNHLLHLVHELLDFRNLEDHKLDLQVSEGDWVLFCKEIFLSFREVARHRNIKMKFTAPEKPILLWFDKNQMEKVINNLLSNALKFTPEGGKVTMDIKSEHNAVFTLIKDTGIGIAEHDIPRIFKRFYQSETSGSKQGFGLGLAISREIVALHHGRIDVKSTPGKGAGFTVAIPCGKKHFNHRQLMTENRPEEKGMGTGFPLSPEKEYSSGFAGIGGYTILIAEDNREIRRYIAGLLGSGCRILEADHGKAALDICRKELPDLVISDIMMPVMDGIAFTRQLKSDTDTSHIPVVLLTARTSLPDKLEGYETGADAYITKPFSEAMLLSRINNLIVNRKKLQKKYGSSSLLPEEMAINTTDRQFMDKLFRVLRENLISSDLNAEVISREIGMSHSVVYKKIKSLTGMTFVDFVRDYKLKVAKELIEKQGVSVADACYRIGYSDRKYFSRIFKKKFGKNPSEFQPKG